MRKKTPQREENEIFPEETFPLEKKSPFFPKKESQKNKYEQEVDVPSPSLLSNKKLTTTPASHPRFDTQELPFSQPPLSIEKIEQLVPSLSGCLHDKTPTELPLLSTKIEEGSIIQDNIFLKNKLVQEEWDKFS